MFERVAKRMAEMVRANDFVLTRHAKKEMDEDCLTSLDVERGVLTGRIVARQTDRATGEPKYLLKGRTIEDDDVFLVAKLSPIRKLVIITVYLVCQAEENRDAL